MASLCFRLISAIISQIILSLLDPFYYPVLCPFHQASRELTQRELHLTQRERDRLRIELANRRTSLDTALIGRIASSTAASSNACSAFTPVQYKVVISAANVSSRNKAATSTTSVNKQTSNKDTSLDAGLMNKDNAIASGQSCTNYSDKTNLPYIRSPYRPARDSNHLVHKAKAHIDAIDINAIPPSRQWSAHIWNPFKARSDCTQPDFVETNATDTISFHDTEREITSGILEVTKTDYGVAESSNVTGFPIELKERKNNFLKEKAEGYTDLGLASLDQNAGIDADDFKKKEDDAK
ncbi:unnamed protein product, partial [Protopolystoma xenopodis]